MQIDERSRAMKRMMEGMRALSDDEIADIQKRQAPLMMNAADQMRGAAGMQNCWASEPAHWIPEPPKPTFWQRVKRLFVRHNVLSEGPPERSGGNLPATPAGGPSQLAG